MFRPQSFQCLEAATDASGKVTGWKHCVVGDGEFLLITRHQDSLLRGAQPVHRAARRLARHPAQALARGRPRVQHVRDRELRRPDGGRRRAWIRSSSGSSAWAPRPRRARCFETRRADVRLEGEAAGRPRARHLDHRALGLARRRRGRDLGRPAQRQDPRAQGVGRDRRRRHRDARPGQGQRRERHHLRPLQRAARARDHQGRRSWSSRTSTTTT